MNYDQALGIARQVFTLAGGIAVGRGWITADMVTAIVGALPALISIYFVYKKASPEGQLAAVAANPEVKKIVTTPAVATAAPSPKVVPQ
jgi:hypothetical protein